MTGLASRVKKARRDTLCPHCGNRIRIGQQIALTTTWIHVACAIAAMQTSAPTEGGTRKETT